ncbi:MAG: thiamine pyrophosphate-binding protein, partial [Cyanobacteria bacterium P01_A01_bin.83]
MNTQPNIFANNQVQNSGINSYTEQNNLDNKKLNPSESKDEKRTHIVPAKGTNNKFKFDPSLLEDLKPETKKSARPTPTSPQTEPQRPLNVSQAVVKMLEDMGVKHAFGVSGGAIAPMWHALQHSNIEVMHFRHEAGAAFAATEAYFASEDEAPVVIFTTTGPGITNALTGLYAARWEGAKVIFISACTSAPQRGKCAFQETSTYTMPHSNIFTSGELFHYATTLECAEQLPEVSRRINLGLKKPDGFVSHLSIPVNIQSSLPPKPLKKARVIQSIPTASEKTIAECAELLAEESFAIWVGFGARKASKAIRELAEK